MYIVTLLTLLVLSSALNCPIDQRLRSTVISGSLSAQPEAKKKSQDMIYTNNFENALSRSPQVCLSISGYEDSNEGYIKINANAQDISTQSFSVRVTSPDVSRWTKLGLHYLVSTKSEIQIGTASIVKPIYNSDGQITLKYTPSLSLNKNIKVRQFIVGLDVQSNVGNSLSLNFQKLQIKSSYINFLFSSANCNIYALTLSVVVFDPLTPGLLFVDGSLEQNSLSTTTQVSIEKTYMEQLRIYFVGFNSINARDRSGLKLSVQFSNTFSIMIDSTSIKSIKVNYLVIAIIDCGSCSGYSYFYNDKCYKDCPYGTVLKYGSCVPIQCKNGYELNSQSECVPVCGPNRYYSGKSCTCNDGYNLIKGQCKKCPSGTFFNYMTLKCEDICGENSQFNATDKKCYCYKGYVVIGDKCSTCPAGTKYDSKNLRCLDEPIDCGDNEVVAFGKCVCAKNYNKINGKCEKCPAYSSFSNGFCKCDDGYELNGQICESKCGKYQEFINGKCQCVDGTVRSRFGTCVGNCNANEQWKNGACACVSGYEKNKFGVCVATSVTCPDLEVLVGSDCKCIKGYKRGSNGRCYQVTCQSGYYLDDSDTCVPNCASGTTWDQTYKSCLPTCATGLTYDQIYRKCVPVCATDYKWNGVECFCVKNCQIVCPSGTFYNKTTNRCQSKICQQKEVWDGQRCICPSGYDYYNGICSIQRCQSNQEWVNQRCQCKPGYTYDSKGVCRATVCPSGQKWDDRLYRCVDICPDGKYWLNGYCVCEDGTWDNGVYCITCPANQQYINGRCTCKSGFYLISGVCSECPSGQSWDPSSNSCKVIIICSNGKIWNGFKCVCPNGFVETQFNSCRKECSADKITLPSGQCVCRDGQKQNNYGVCVDICDQGYVYTKGKCLPPCGKGEEWSGYNCVCQPGYERIAPNVCSPSCGVNQQRNGYQCQCKPGYVQTSSGCIQLNNCPFPHQWSNGNCNCAATYEKDQTGTCIPICASGYARNSKGICVLNCSNDKILVDGKCVCRVGLHNVNGLCSKCPEFSYQTYGKCYCSVNNYPISGGDTCPVPSCSDPNSYWDNKVSGCVCRAPMVWLYGSCQNPRNCGQYQVFNGAQCVCINGYRRVSGVCQKVNINYYCPDNSIFNGINCQCLQGFYPVNRQYCQRCPMNNFWNGRECGSSAGVCRPGFEWDNRRSACIYRPRCQQNQQWNGAQCVCSQGYFWIEQRCQECPAGTVFDGKRCNRGDSSRCRGSYSYWNGFSCVCIPNFWQLSEGCVTCPSGFQWNGICCQFRGGLLRATADDSDPMLAMSVSVTIK